MNLFCLFNFHVWTYNGDKSEVGTIRTCKKCGRSYQFTYTHTGSVWDQGFEWLPVKK